MHTMHNTILPFVYNQIGEYSEYTIAIASAMAFCWIGEFVLHGQFISVGECNKAKTTAKK